MILIDRSKDNQSFVLTLGLGAFSDYVFILKSDATREEFTLSLPAYSSNKRYDKFMVSTAVFSDLPEGYFAYKVRPSITTEFIESGKLYVLPVAQPQPAQPYNDNDILVFTK